MRHFLTSLLALHWAVAFALLATACVAGGPAGANLALDLLGIKTAGLLAGPSFAALLSLGFAVVSVLFFWALVVAAFTEDILEGDEVVRMAFAAAAGVLSMVLVVGALSASSGVLPAIAITLAALMASYLAIRAEHRSIATAVVSDGEDFRSAARLMAAEAAHNSMLTRLTGRADLNPDGSR